MELAEEKWKSINGYEGRYEVSNLGRVRSLIYYGDNKRASPLVLKLRSAKGGYLRISLRTQSEYLPKTFPVHRLVLLAFTGEPVGDKNKCMHLNDIRTDNKLDNLQWGSTLDNVHDMIKKGRKVVSRAAFGRKGKESPSSKPVSVHIEGVFFKNFYSIGEACNELKISKSHASENANNIYEFKRRKLKLAFI